MAGWTDDEDAILKRGLKRGDEYQIIARKLPGRTPKAIGGRVHRLGLSGPGRVVPCVSIKAKAKRKAKASISTKKINSNQSAVFGDMGGLSNGSRPCGKALVVVEAGAQTKEVESLEPVTLLEREEHQCCWPLGDPQDDDFRYCGNEKKDGHAHYCEGHAGVERQKLRRRKNIVPENRDQRVGQSSALQGWF